MSIYQMMQKRNSHIFGASWAKVASPTLTRTGGAIGRVALAGTDLVTVRNDFDHTPIFGEFTEVTDSLGNVFVRIPKFYIKKTDGVGYKTWQVSKIQHSGFYLPWCFWDFTASAELPYIDVGKHKASLSVANKLESIPDVYPLINTTIVNTRTYAQANNTGGLLGYQQIDVHVADVLRTLMYIEFATLNLQSVMYGFANGRYIAADVATVAENNVNRIIVANATATPYVIGQAISVGTALGGNQVFYGRTITSIDVYDAANKAISFDGATVNIAINNILYNTGWKNGFGAGIAASSGSLVSNATGLYPCVYRGIESPYGDVWQWIDGININERQAWITPNAENYASNLFAAPYEQLGYVDHNANGYTTAVGWDADYPYAELPTAVGGGAATYYGDYYYQDAGQRVALCGGYWYYGDAAGPSFWYLPLSSGFAHVTVGGRLVKKAL